MSGRTTLFAVDLAAPRGKAERFFQVGPEQNRVRVTNATPLKLPLCWLLFLSTKILDNTFGLFRWILIRLDGAIATLHQISPLSRHLLTMAVFVFTSATTRTAIIWLDIFPFIIQFIVIYRGQQWL